MTKLICPKCESDAGFTKIERSVSQVDTIKEMYDPDLGDAHTVELIGIECLNCEEYFIDVNSDYQPTVWDVVEYSEHCEEVNK